jgi:hypothetical protein
MNTIDFIKDIPAEQLAEIFRKYFEQHMMAYFLLKGMHYTGTRVSIDNNSASIMYAVKLDNPNEKSILEHNLKVNAGKLNIYGKVYTPEVYMNGDLLCITIKKDTSV